MNRLSTPRFLKKVLVGSDKVLSLGLAAAFLLVEGVAFLLVDGLGRMGLFLKMTFFLTLFFLDVVGSS